jgi:hypothetical protein
VFRAREKKKNGRKAFWIIPAAHGFGAAANISCTEILAVMEPTPYASSLKP